MLDAREHAAPGAAVNRLVNNAADLYINPIATQDPVVDAPEQIEKPALFTAGRVAARLVIVSPCFGFILQHYWPHIILLLGQSQEKWRPHSSRGTKCSYVLYLRSHFLEEVCLQCCSRGVIDKQTRVDQ